MAKVFTLGTVKDPTDVALEGLLFGIELVEGQNVGTIFFIINFLLPCQNVRHLLIHQFRMEVSCHG